MAVGTWQQSGPSRGSWCCFQARLPSLGVRHQGPPPPPMELGPQRDGSTPGLPVKGFNLGTLIIWVVWVSLDV